MVKMVAARKKQIVVSFVLFVAILAVISKTHYYYPLIFQLFTTASLLKDIYDNDQYYPYKHNFTLSYLLTVNHWIAWLVMYGLWFAIG